MGIRIQQGKLQLSSTLGELLPQVVPNGQVANVTVEDLLRMRDGFDFDELYEPGSGVTDILFGCCKKTVVNLLARTSNRISPGNCFQYSSVSTNVLSLALRATFDSLEEYANFPYESLFKTLGLDSMVLETDSDGIFLASSFGWGTARDWARIGMLYLSDGVWDGRRVLPEGWTAFSSSPTSTSRGRYGAHFWLGGPNVRDPNPERISACDHIYSTRTRGRQSYLNVFPEGSMVMHGFEEQVVAIDPANDAVIVRLGATKEVVIRWDRAAFYARVFDAVA